MTQTSIEWTDATWNPVTGCSKISPGCAHCYAERLAPKVFAGQEVVVQEGGGECSYRPRVFTDVWTHATRLDAPLHWRKPRRVFVNSMSDLFHEDVSDAFIDRVFAVMAVTPRHTFQILTKRAERMHAYVSAPMRYTRIAAVLQNDRPDLYIKRPTRWPFENVWLGVSVENQVFADFRIPFLVQTPAAVRFLSCEPLLESVDLSAWLKVHEIDLPSGAHWTETMRGAPELDWIIVGGESGPKARPFDVAWGRLLVAQCRAADVPVFMKQLGRFPRLNGVYPDSFSKPSSLHDRKGGDPTEWPHDLRVREFPR